MNYDDLLQKKKELDTFRPLPPELVQNLEHWFRIELTYTSNAIEGNTLTRQETAIVVDKGLTVGGKPLKDHLEAINHAKALDWIEGLVGRKPTQITEPDILKIHEFILKDIDDDNAGRYRRVMVRIAGSRVILPNPVKVPYMMDEFVQWLQGESGLHPVELAALAHYKLVSIHPFVDGNGRTARLLMNLILMQSGYPPALIRTRDRLPYINSLEKAQMDGPLDDYHAIIIKAVDRSLDIYLKAVRNEEPLPETKPSTAMLRIGQLAKQTGEGTATIRHWTKESLLQVASTTPSGYQLYEPDAVERVRKIRELQARRLTLAEIKEHLK